MVLAQWRANIARVGDAVRREREMGVSTQYVCRACGGPEGKGGRFCIPRPVRTARVGASLLMLAAI